MREHDAAAATWRPPRDPAASDLMERVLWRVNRLRCMTHAEIRHRALRALAMQAELWGLLRSATVPPPDRTHLPSPSIHAQAKANEGGCLTAAAPHAPRTPSP